MQNPANSELLKYLSSRASPEWINDPICRPEETAQPYLSLGAHPDIVEHLWQKLAKPLPSRCDWVVYRTPVLVHPQSATIFGMALGTVYALRFPADARTEAASAGAKSIHAFYKHSLDLSPFGEGWLFGTFHKEEERWCLRAYEDAEKP